MKTLTGTQRFTYSAQRRWSNGHRTRSWHVTGSPPGMRACPAEAVTAGWITGAPRPWWRGRRYLATLDPGPGNALGASSRSRVLGQARTLAGALRLVAEAFDAWRAAQARTETATRD